MQEIFTDLYLFFISFCKNNLFYIVIAFFVVFAFIFTKFKNRKKELIDSEVMNIEDSLIGLHDSNCKRILKLERQVKNLENLVHEKELEIKKLEKQFNNFK